MDEDIKPKGFVDRGKTTVVTAPKFEDCHIKFMEQYLSAKVTREGNNIRIHAPLPASKLELAIRAYEYDFGPWNKK
jgi:hypothetical protein